MSARPLAERVADFLAEGPWAVVGASRDRAKYGNKVLRCYLQNGKRPVWPIHPREAAVEGEPAFRALAATPERPRAVSIVTPPAVSAAVVQEAAALGIEHLWLQPGAEDEDVLARARALGLEPIAGGPCLLVALGYRE